MTDFGLCQVLTPHILWYMIELFDNDGVYLSDFGKPTYIQSFRNLISKTSAKSFNKSREYPSG